MEKKLKDRVVYIAGKISGNPNYKFDFAIAEEYLKNIGVEKILNPTMLPDNLDYEVCMNLCFAMIKEADLIFFMDNWTESSGAKREHAYATALCKDIMYGEQ